MKNISTKAILVIILIVAAALRLWNLAGVPPATSMDEASIGYNAYSVIQTGRDEYGDVPLISQRGYDDWRRSLYLFLVTPFIAIFGLNVISIRLPSVVLSLFTIWSVYHIVLLLFSKRSQLAHYAACIASLLLALSPWHVYISRIGHESNAYISFAVFGMLFFLQGVRQKGRFMVSMICFTLSIISYYAGQVFVPLLGLGIIFLFWDSLAFALRSDNKFRMSFVIVALFCVAAVSMTFAPSAVVRFAGTSTFNPDAHYEEYTKRIERWNEAIAEGDIMGRIRNSKYLFPLEVFGRSYLSHFNIKWLFMNSSAEPFKAPNMGLLYLWQLPFILVGIIVFLFSRDIDPRSKKMLILWALLSPLPASIATQAPHAMRSYPSMLTWQIFTAFGLSYALTRLTKMNMAGMVIIGALLVSGFTSFFYNYFTVFPNEQSSSFHYALSNAIRYVIVNGNTYEKIVFSNEDNLYQSYMLFLYYSKYDPMLYQKQGGTRSGGYAETHVIDKYEFRPILKEEPLLSNVLYIGNTVDFTSPVAPIAQFANLDGNIAIQAVSIP